MSLHYRFTHACGHIGIGPLIDTSGCTHSNFLDNEKLTTIQLELPFSCPYCPRPSNNPTLVILEVPLGYGILTVISQTWPWNWCIRRVCKYEDITPQEWAQSMSENGGFRQMAWIPKPCGEVRAIGGLGGVRREEHVTASVTIEVTSAWKQRADQLVKSRFAGLLSQLNAAVLSGHRAGR
ncbi:hypothetical protein N431DRAFT_491108 [Stipitochalara longipes BDJ]|nr:hypothetical protein N431DRAFT_491108 [Stipitochalara longipes BDJ]